MEKKKCFIFVSHYDSEFLEEDLIELGKEKGIEFEVTQHKDVNGIPKDYDIYFIHLRDLNEEYLHGLSFLQNSQPESYFIKLGLGQGLFKGNEKILSADRLITPEDLDNILFKLINGINNKYGTRKN